MLVICGSLKFSSTDVAIVLPGFVPAFSSGVPFRPCEYSGYQLGDACVCDNENEEGDG